MSQYFERELNIEEIRGLKEIMEGFLDHPGWPVLCDWLQTRAMYRRNELYDMCPANMEQAVAFARLKGGIDELQLLPEAFGATLLELTQMVRKAQEQEYDEEYLTDTDPN